MLHLLPSDDQVNTIAYLDTSFSPNISPFSSHILRNMETTLVFSPASKRIWGWVPLAGEPVGHNIIDEKISGALSTSTFAESVVKSIKESGFDNSDGTETSKVFNY